MVNQRAVDPFFAVFGHQTPLQSVPERQNQVENNTNALGDLRDAKTWVFSTLASQMHRQADYQKESANCISSISAEELIDFLEF